MKNNKLLLVVLFLFFVVVLSFANNLKGQNSPYNLTYNVEDENDVFLFWNPPASDSVYIHWDNGTNNGTFNIDADTFSVAAMWDQTYLTGYDQWKIIKMKFFIANPANVVKLKIWAGEDATEVYSQDITTYSVGDWTEVVLDEPYILSSSQEIRAGLYIETIDTGAVVGVDAGPVLNGYGNIYYANGEWKTQIAGNWNIELLIQSPPPPVYLHWDGEHIDNYFGFFLDGEREYSCSAKWNPEHLTDYNSWKITSVKYVLKEINAYKIKLKIYEGVDRVEVYSQDITDFVDGGWTETQLNTPYTIDASKELYVGIYVWTFTPGTPIGMDSDPLVVGQGFWLYYKLNGNWTWFEGSDPLISIGNNMNMRLLVESPEDKNGDKAKSLLGYNVYKNGNLVTPEPVTANSYVDMNLLNGVYDYYVTAIYENGESEPSDTVEVVINQPVILKQDSLALVDIYNQCGGENWNINDLWLEGPVNEWYGVITEGTRVKGVFLQFNILSGILPESISNLTALEYLHVEGNYYLSELPESIGNLTSLKVLWCSYTTIDNIPETIGNMTSLEDVNFNSLSLSQLPESIGNLPNLKKIAVVNTGITALPQSFGNLSSLEYFFASHNNLTFLPEGFGNLGEMYYIDLSNNNLISLSSDFGNMTKLRYLYLEFNNIEELPETFGNLESLYFFDATSNKIASIPENMGDLDNLSIMGLGGNLLTQLPASFGDMTSLDTLVLAGNQLSALPENFGNLDDMSFCSLSQNQLLSLPESFVNLETIKYLDIDVNNLTSLPESIGNLTTLVYLSCAVNQISEIPESLYDLNNLKTLNLNQNEISVVSERIADIDSLLYLGLSVNNLTELPYSVGDINLVTLTVNHNHIKELPESMFDNIYHFLYVNNNNLQFGSIEPLYYNVTESFAYFPQSKIGNDTIVELQEGEDFVYTIEVSGDYNSYQWFKDGILLNGQENNTLEIDNVSAEDQGAYVLKVSNGIVTDLILESNDVVLSLVTEIDHDYLKEFSIYPNPVATSGCVNITVPHAENVKNISIFSLKGKLLKTEIVKNTETLVKLDNMPSGVYIVVLKLNKGKSVSKKLVIR
jgi:Leucine-rich repeat (LRR) protein